MSLPVINWLKKQTNKQTNKQCFYLRHSFFEPLTECLPRSLDWGDKRNDGAYLTEFFECERLAGSECLADFKCLRGYDGRHCSHPADGFMFLGAFSVEWCSNRVCFAF